MSAGEGNVFYQAGRALLTQLDKHEQASDPTLLLAGSESEVEKRWACSAIKLKQDAGWLVVPGACAPASVRTRVQGVVSPVVAHDCDLRGPTGECGGSSPRLRGVGVRGTHLAYILYIFWG